MMRPNGVEKQVRPSRRQPGANTLVYYKINDNDTNTTIYDLSGNGVDQTWHGTPGYTTDATYGRVATFDGSSYTQAGSIVDFGDECTFIVLVKQSNTDAAFVIECTNSSDYGIGLASMYGTSNKYVGWFSGITGIGGDLHVDSQSDIVTSQWKMIAATRSSDGTSKIYINGILNNTKTLSSAPDYSNGEYLQISRRRNGDTGYLNGQFKLFIGENRTWTDQEISDLASEYGF